MEPLFKILNAAHRLGEITVEDSKIMLALHTMSTAHEYTPVMYPPCPEAISRYCNDRRNDMIPRSKDFAVANGEWLLATRSAKRSNAMSIELLSDDMQVLREAGQDDAADEIKKMYDKLIRNEASFFLERYAAHSEVQSKDMRERRITEGH